MTAEGLASFRDDSLRAFRRDAIPAGAARVVRDQAGYLWIGTEQGGIYQVDPGGQVQRFGPDEGMPPLAVTSLLVDRSGAVWAGLQGGLVRIRNDKVEVVPHPGGRWPARTSVQLLDADGNVWIAADADGWWRFDPSGAGTRVARPVHGGWTGEIAMAPDQSLWRSELDTAATSTNTGTLYRNGQPVVTVSSAIRRFALDSSGGAWIATASGLVRVAPRPLRVIGAEAGLPNVNVYPILQDRSGRFWVGTFGGGVVRLGTPPSPPITTSRGGNVLSLHEDRDGTIWVGQFGPTCRIVETRCIEASLPGAGAAIRGDSRRARDL
jgi:ligand-binding sensor domain-containing protein